MSNKNFLISESLLTRVCEYLIDRPYKEVYALLSDIEVLQSVESQEMSKTPVILNAPIQVKSLDEVENPEILQGSNNLREKITRN